MAKTLKTKKKHVAAINFGKFPGKILLISGYSTKEAIQKIKKIEGPYWAEAFKMVVSNFDETTFGGLANLTISSEPEGKNKECHYFIYFPRPIDFSDYSICELAHEAVHICQNYRKENLKKKMKYKDESYIFKHIMKQCLSILRN